MKNLVILILLALLVWFGSAIVRLENIRYANELNLCPPNDPLRPASAVERSKCLQQVQTRTSFAYHLLYGLRIL